MKRILLKRLFFKSFSLQKGDRLDSRDFEPFPTAQVLAGDKIISANHVGAGFGEPGPIALIGPRRKLALLGANEPGEIVLARLPAMGTGQGVRPLLLFLVKHFALFHVRPPGKRDRGDYCIMGALLSSGRGTMTKRRKKKKFSATKAVKSLARDTIGAPPPVQRIPTLKESRREQKHKPTLGKMLEEE